MFDLQQKAEVEGRQSEAKVWSVLVAQVWAGFASYCSAPPDLSTVSILLYPSDFSLIGLSHSRRNFRNLYPNCYTHKLIFAQPSLKH